MTIRILEKGSERFYKEVINVSSQYRRILKKPRRKLKNHFKGYMALLILCAVVGALDLVTICLFGAGTGETALLACLVFLMAICAAFLFRWNKLKKNMMEGFRPGILSLDEDGIALSKEDAQTVKLNWRSVALIRMFREGMYFISSEPMGFMISVSRKYEPEIVAWLRENRPELEVVADRKKRQPVKH